MKTINKLIAAAFITSVAIGSTVQADSSLSSLIYEESSNIYSEVNQQSSSPVGILSYGDTSNGGSVWSTEFEQYVDPADFKQADMASAGGINQYMESNPTAAGQGRTSVFIYNDNAGEYQLQ